MRDLNDSPMEYRTEPLSDGMRFILPRRSLGRAKWVGCGPIFFGCFFSGFALFWMWGALGLASSGQEAAADPGRFFFALFGVPFFIVGLMPIGLGLAMIVGHTEIELTTSHLTVRECVGPVGRRRRRSIDDLLHIDIMTGKANLPNAGKAMAMATHLVARFRQGKDMRFAWGYSADLVSQLARELADELKKITGRTAPVEEKQILPALPALRAATTFGDLAEQPAASNALLERQAGGLTLHLPPTGFDKAARSMLFFGIIWSAFTSLFLIIPLANDDAPPFLLLVLIPFVAIGLAMIIAAVNAARRRAIVDVVHSTLLITQRSIFGQRQREWQRAELAAIHAGPSNMSVNNQPIPHLQLTLRDGNTVGLFRGRSEEELRWIATLLRQALHLTEPSDSQTAAPGTGKRDKSN